MKRFGLCLFLAVALVDCGGGDGGGPTMITAVVISGDSTVALAGTRQLTVTALSGGRSVTNGVTFQWMSSDTTLATVGGTGLVSGRARGSVTIAALAVLNGTPTTVSGIKGIRVRIGSIALTPAAPQFPSLGDTVHMTGEARDANNAVVPGIAFAWLSRSGSVASVTPTSATQADVVALANGTSRIVITGDGVSDSVTATVQQVATSLSVTPDTASFDRLGGTVTPAVTGTDARGNPLSPSAINWTSQQSAVATVNPTTGVITSRGGGTTRVIAPSGSLADTVHVFVQQVGARVKLHPQTIDSSRILTTGTMRFIDSVFDGNDSLIRTPAPSVTWSSSSGVASVDADGVVTASSAGPTFIKAISGSGVDSVRVEVVTTPTTLSGSVQPIFNVSCAGCHFSGGAANMNLATGAAFSNIVGVPATESALDRVLQFVPDSSYLVHKVQGTHLVPPANGSGARMPFGCSGGNCLPQGQINIIRNWILQGALNN